MPGVTSSCPCRFTRYDLMEEKKKRTALPKGPSPLLAPYPFDPDFIVCCVGNPDDVLRNSGADSGDDDYDEVHPQWYCSSCKHLVSTHGGGPDYVCNGGQVMPSRLKAKNRKRRAGGGGAGDGGGKVQQAPQHDDQTAKIPPEQLKLFEAAAKQNGTTAEQECRRLATEFTQDYEKEMERKRKERSEAPVIGPAQFLPPSHVDGDDGSASSSSSGSGRDDDDDDDDNDNKKKEIKTKSGPNEEKQQQQPQPSLPSDGNNNKNADAEKQITTTLPDGRVLNGKIAPTLEEAFVKPPRDGNPFGATNWAITPKAHLQVSVSHFEEFMYHMSSAQTTVCIDDLKIQHMYDGFGMGAGGGDRLVVTKGGQALMSEERSAFDGPASSSSFTSFDDNNAARGQHLPNAAREALAAMAKKEGVTLDRFLKAIPISCL